jgi:hypothetical protein
LIDLTNLDIVRHDQIEIWNNQIKNKIKMYEYDLINNEPLSAMSTIFKGHTESYCNLVIEHSMEIEILSEKSFKPFIAKQIPAYLAQAGACEMLTKLGFDLFYDFINHDEYDAIGKGFVNRCPEPWVKRTSKLHALIDDLYTTKFCDFFTEANTKHRLEKNNEHFYSNTIDKMCITKFNQLLNNIKAVKENEKKEQAFMRENDKNIKRLGRPINETRERNQEMKNTPNIVNSSWIDEQLDNDIDTNENIEE